MFHLGSDEVREFRENGKKVIKLVRVRNGENPAAMWYKYKNPAIQGFNYFIGFLCKGLPPLEIKNSMYRLIGVKIGRNVAIAPDCIIDPLFPELIRIDDNVIIGWGTRLYTHEFTQNTVRIGTVHIKKNSLVGEWSVVRPGVSINENALVAAMSFVNMDIPRGFVEGGVPVHVIGRSRTNASAKRRKLRRRTRSR